MWYFVTGEHYGHTDCLCNGGNLLVVRHDSSAAWRMVSTTGRADNAGDESLNHISMRRPLGSSYTREPEIFVEIS